MYTDVCSIYLCMYKFHLTLSIYMWIYYKYVLSINKPENIIYIYTHTYIKLYKHAENSHKYLHVTYMYK